jgi:glycosyltransferase involved in cell wall biosynthesis
MFGLEHRDRGRVRRLLGGMPVPEVDFLTRSHVYLLEAVERVLRADPSLRFVLQVHLVGALTDADREVASRSPVVRLHGYVDHATTVELVVTADLLFLPMQDLPVGMRAGLVPGKTYEYLRSGRPILAAVPDGDARDLLAEAGNAFLCRPADVTAMAEAIAGEVKRWRAGVIRPGPNPAVVGRYERRRQTGELARLLDDVLDR